MLTPPTFYDDGEDSGSWADALMLPPWRQISPDTFANFTQDPSARHSDSDDLAGPAVILSHDDLNMPGGQHDHV